MQATTRISVHIFANSEDADIPFVSETSARDAAAAHKWAQEQIKRLRPYLNPSAATGYTITKIDQERFDF